MLAWPVVQTILRLTLSLLFHSAYQHHPQGSEEGSICYPLKACQPNPMLRVVEMSCLPGQSLPRGQCSRSCPCKKDMTVRWTRAESPGKDHLGAAVSWVLFHSLVLSSCMSRIASSVTECLESA